MTSYLPKQNARTQIILVLSAALLVAIGGLWFVSTRYFFSREVVCQCKNLEEASFRVNEPDYRIVNGSTSPALTKGLPWMAFLFIKLKRSV